MKPSRFLPFISIFIYSTMIADTLHVPSQYPTIQEAANAAQPGDICLVGDGTYNSFTLPRDGAPGMWLIFKAADGHYPVITGSISLDNRDYIHIEGFQMDGSISNSSNSRATNIRIINNDFVNNSIDINLHANNVLIEGNTSSNTSDDFIRVFGMYWIVRNNSMQNEDASSIHMDFIQSWEVSGYSAAYILFENNTMVNISGGHVHTLLFNDTDRGNPRDVRNVIIRYNKIHNIGSMACYLNDDPNQEAPTYNNVIYNNTFSRMNEGDHATWQKYAQSCGASDNSAGINNIFIDAMDFSGTTGFDWGSGCAQSYNLYFDPDNTMTFSGLASGETGAVKNQDPLIADMNNGDFSISPDSPARDSGGPLTFVSDSDIGSGTALVVDKAEFFQDGSWVDGTEPDWIVIGNTDNAVQISSIDYDSNIITLANSVLRADGDAVWLYKISDGTRVIHGQAPDIGAYEFISTVDIDATERTVTGFNLEQNYPNPFNPTTKIKYSIPAVVTTRRVVSAPNFESSIVETGHAPSLLDYNSLLPVKLAVYDILGREVATLVNKQQRSGNYTVQFDASGLPTGIYIYKLTAGSFTQSRKMLLLR